MAVLELRGCTPEPLGNYLKGLGVFRLIAEQADPLARAWWKNGFLHIRQSKWDARELTKAEESIVDWLLTECHFTPLIAPWQTGTGYLGRGKRSVGGEALTALLKADHPGAEYFRGVFRDFAASIGVALAEDPSNWLEQMKETLSEVSDAHIIRLLRNGLRSASALRWLDAVGMSVSRSRDADFPSWFAILASGGGEASGQYVVNHQQRLKAALLDDTARSRCWLISSLFAHNQPGTLEANAMGAMYYPSLMKAPNVGQDFLPNPQRRVNPWDFILLLEGAAVWSIAATRRSFVTSERGSFPFYCRSSFGGSMIIGPKEVEGAEQSIAMGELWCPTWNRPSTLAEIQRIFGEGRIQIGDKICSRSLDFALAMRGLGTDRGIHAFHRYSLLKRSGSGRQTTLIAVANGCFVPDRRSGLSLVKELREFAESVATNLVDNSQQPRQLVSARIEFERAWYDATASMISANEEAFSERISNLITAVGRLMRQLGANSRRPGFVKSKKDERTSEKVISPVGDLGSDWTTITGKSDISAVYRLARAVAGIGAWGEASVQGKSAPAVEVIRTNLLPLARQGNSWDWSQIARSVVWARGASLAANLAAVLRRRLIDAQRGVGDGLPLWSPFAVGFQDLLAFWYGEVEEQRTTDLIYGLSLVNAGKSSESHPSHEPTPDLQTGAVSFDSDERAWTHLRPLRWERREVLDSQELRAAFELPRIYHLLKLCFIGGRLPRRPMEGMTVARSGDEPFPPRCLDVLTLLEAGRLSEAVQVAARRLRAKGYPALMQSSDMKTLEMDSNQCRRLAGMLLIPVRQPGVLAALAVKPETV